MNIGTFYWLAYRQLRKDEVDPRTWGLCWKCRLTLIYKELEDSIKRGDSRSQAKWEALYYREACELA